MSTQMAEGGEEVPVIYLHEIKRQYVQGETPLVILDFRDTLVRTDDGFRFRHRGSQALFVTP